MSDIKQGSYTCFNSYSCFQQVQLDELLVNLRMEAVFLKENFNIKWVAQNGLVESIDQVVTEYKQSRGLLVKVAYSSWVFGLKNLQKGWVPPSFPLILYHFPPTLLQPHSHMAFLHAYLMFPSSALLVAQADRLPLFSPAEELVGSQIITFK